MPKLTAQYKLNEEQLNQLKQIVPEVFKDNILDFNSLYEALSDFTEDDTHSDIEQFGLSWPGKRQAKRAAAIPPVGTLAPVPGDGVDEDTTKNIYIEGDNLEVLKILRKAYTGRIKMIYIDPPYNTGNDFIYPDDFSESVESFQRRTGQLNENNEKMTTNNRSDGRFHSKWCSMIYPRLRLARELLTEDGVIFISIDDNEVAQLYKFCNELFGDGNFIATFIWKSKPQGGNDNTHIVSENEYILMYCKNTNSLTIKGRVLNEDKYKMKDQYFDIRGGFSLVKMDLSTLEYRVNLDYPIKTPDGTVIYAGGVTKQQWLTRQQTNTRTMRDWQWRWSEERLKTALENGFVEFKKRNNIWNIYTKEYQNVDKDGKLILRERKHRTTIDFCTNIDGTKECEELVGRRVFSFPKPSSLVKYFSALVTLENSIILDFFSGSSTTAHAVMQLNAEDNGNRQYIMVQIQEPCKEDTEAFKAGYKNICEIGKERIRRAGKKIKEEAGLNAANLDTGFKVYRLAPSNYKAWENYNGTDVKQLEELFKADSLMQGWKEDNLLTEVMLLEGFPLDSKIELLPQFKKNKVKKISSYFLDNTLYICFDKDIVKETIEILNLTDKERFICLDSAIDDQSKIRLEDKNLIKTL